MTKQVINSIYTQFEDFTLNIQNYFIANQNTIHKARNELKEIVHKDVLIIVKSFKKPHILNQIIYSYFRSSKAKRSYDNSLKLQELSPQPISYIEFHKNNLLQDSYFISEKFNYDFTIREPLLDNSFEDKEIILRAFARFSLQVHNKGIFHDDYSPGNILIKKEGSGFLFKVVDVNRMRFFDLQEDDRAKNFSKLWASDEELKIIANEYKKYYQCSESFSDKVCYYSNKNKKIKNFKKKLKGQAVND